MEYLTRKADKGNEEAAKKLDQLTVGVDPLAWEMFSLLSGQRQGPDGPRAITVPEIESAFRVFCVGGLSLCRRVAYLLLEMDKVYLRKEWARLRGGDG